jgi:hypothetical protein
MPGGWYDVGGSRCENEQVGALDAMKIGIKVIGTKPKSSLPCQRHSITHRSPAVPALRINKDVNFQLNYAKFNQRRVKKLPS